MKWKCRCSKHGFSREVCKMKSGALQASRFATPDPGDLFRWAEQLPSPLWDDLKARPPLEAAAASGAVWEDGKFEIPLVGVTYQIDPGARRIVRRQNSDRRVGFQCGMVLVTALAKSLGAPPSGRMVTPQELKGGSLFFTGAHSLAVKPLEKRFGHDPEALIASAKRFGGVRIEGADCAVALPGLPMVPLYVLLWRADDEFEARAVIGIDDRALFHLDLAGVFGLTNVMVGRLIGD
jgi:hypothetical protein